MIDAEKPGRFIADLRKEKNLTQRELAEKLNVSDKAVSRWETGRGFPDISSLEDIAAVLNANPAEILRGERIPPSIDTEEMRKFTEDSTVLVKELFRRRTVRSILTGFLISLILFILAIVHLNSPVYLNDPGDQLTAEELSDGRVIAVIRQPVSGFELNDIVEPETGAHLTFLSCYETLFDRLTGRSREAFILLGRKDDLYQVWYYPGNEGDRLIYTPYQNHNSGGIISLPRLVYNMWTAAGAALSAAALIVFFFLRRTRYAETALKLSMIPFSFTLSIFLVLFRKWDQVYNASYYLSGILIVTILLYLLFLSLYGMYRKKQKA